MYHLQKRDGSHEFNPGTTFNDIVLHYQFDKKLRSLVQEYLERIEVALRSHLTDKFSIDHGFFWYSEINLYEDHLVHASIMEEIINRFDDPQENFLKAFKIKYFSESLPPSNMAMETLSLGKLARLYKGLKNNSEKGLIASEFGLPSTILSSWFVYIANVRNICAHHSRLWNRRITADRPTIPSRQKFKFHGSVPSDFNTTMYGVSSMIDRLLKKINPANSFIEKLKKLLCEYPIIDTKLMGFPSDWESNPAWKEEN